MRSRFCRAQGRRGKLARDRSEHIERRHPDHCCGTATKLDWQSNPESNTPFDSVFPWQNLPQDRHHRCYPIRCSRELDCILDHHCYSWTWVAMGTADRHRWCVQNGTMSMGVQYGYSTGLGFSGLLFGTAEFSERWTFCIWLFLQSRLLVRVTNFGVGLL